jgi:hypothetical protein
VAAGQGGTWKVAVSGADDAGFTGAHSQAFAYRLVVSRRPASHVEADESGNDTEPELIPLPGDDTFENLAPGGVVTVRGTLLASASGASDVDLYGLPVSPAQQLFAAVFSENGSSEDPVVRLRRPDTSEVDRDDDDGPGLLPSFRAPSSAAPGAWTLEVTRFEGHPEVDEDLPYTLVLASAGRLCDANLDAAVDDIDVQSIFDARGSSVSPADPRDLNGSGLITVSDARACVNRCDLPACLRASCGLLGVEALLPLALLGRRLRRRRAAEDRR